MRIVLTGSSGRVGRAIFSALAGEYDVFGIDRSPFSTTHLVADFANHTLLRSAFEGADAVIHVAALHAPHVGTIPDEEFHRVNVRGTGLVAEAAIAAGVKRLVFTSTTALYGYTVSPSSCTWIDEDTPAQPKSIYHRTKLEAERLLEDIACPELAVRVLRMSRSFPEPGDVMAAYRLHRGVDVRDVADAHRSALTNGGAQFERYIVSAATPFTKADCKQLATDAASIITLRAPALATEFHRRGWSLPTSIDRVYHSSRAEDELDWHPRFGFEEVLAQMDRRSLEVLPTGSGINRKSE
ncbi:MULTISPECIES: NAD-dependent epimerase/dehydratase family protein [unclassified Rhizobium]|uniref:NAD-dependent epimerase/dehydratase family protein n=1 Tax=unclassified Rhizobium TaxID=2613769 RepID=UPI001ADC1D5F|nr:MULTISPECIES: NAD(P)-dependent oxidoreductase [unclassified Rhizobium]MBO9100841.1 NAD(P)-dependent oxidoreductase [Rhizobium sp. L58/93]MBO9170469.1 NAD(P)-dependent oxidoreductase [Rhizobium sp. L245/93]MBO9186394.1 NAD(P)-dependent oxidoreductase [Rhizobium sp. E27B/91]QXZ86285.1 NAD(P)-dependent oxidoreductase [Rhizobium sp. K1/93]QXZ92260.1 NAD(P)-dependent oxidoreductase [Rhizobium sp. K15/93]